MSTDSSDITVNIVDIIPPSDSAETEQNSEPSIAVDPLDPTTMIAGAFSSNPAGPYFLSTNGGANWSDYGAIEDNDKSLAWAANGSLAFTATLTFNSDISLYQGIPGSGNFGSPIFTYDGLNNSNDTDQPWIRTGPSNHVYIAYNDLGASATNGQTASVLVSTDGGASFTPVTLDRVGGTAGFENGQDAPSVRLAVNGDTAYGVFTRWTTFLGNDSSGDQYYNAQVVVVRSDNGGADGFDAIGTGGNGVQVAAPTGYFADQENAPITLGQERTASDLAIAVDPNNPLHVVIAYGDATGSIGSGQLQLTVAESNDGGATWSTKFTTSSATRSSQPALAIMANGTIGFLYDNYDPNTDELSQHLLTTANDFATTQDTILASESNATPIADFDPYLGDFFDLTCIGNTFYGTFCASNADNGTNASFANVTFQRDFTGTPGTSSFQLVDQNGHPVAASIDPFFFNYTVSQIVSAGNSPYNVSAGHTDTNDTVLSGGSMFVLSGGIAESTTVNSGGFLTITKGGKEVGGTVASGGTEIVSSGGVLELTGSLLPSDATLRSGAILEVGPGYVVAADTISKGFPVLVLSGGTSLDPTVSSGGTEIVSAGGTVIGGTVVSGGHLTVSSGGTAELSGSLTPSQITLVSGAVLDVVSGYALSNYAVSKGITLDVQSGGTAAGLTIKTGGLGIIESGSTINNSVTVSNGGTAELVGGTPSNALHLFAGATLEVGSGTVLSGAATPGITVKILSGGMVSSGSFLSGDTADILSGGVASNVTISSGGKVVVFAGGSDISGTILNGGTETGSSGGVDTGAAVGSGGLLQVLAGGVASGASIASGGTEIVSSGGTAVGATVSSGGHLTISRGGTVELTGSLTTSQFTLASGATLAVGPGYTLNSFTVSKGTTEAVLSGGTSLSGTVKSGGVLELIGTNSATFTLSAGATLEAGSAYIFSGTVGGGVTLSGGASSGTLTVSSGGSAVAEINFVGGYTSASFHLSAGSGGEVVITDPGIVAPQPVAGGVHSANVALFGHYIAGTLLISAGGLAGFPIAEQSPIAPLPHLTPPHTG